jgi:hypothetical protein
VNGRLGVDEVGLHGLVQLDGIRDLVVVNVPSSVNIDSVPCEDVRWRKW